MVPRGQATAATEETVAEPAPAAAAPEAAEASLRASRIVSAVVVETAARPVAIAPLPAIPGLSYPWFALIGRGSYHGRRGR